MNCKRFTQLLVFSVAFIMLFCTLPAKAQKYGLEIPRLKSGEVLIRHTGFSLVYSEDDEQAKWVGYTLTKEHAAMKATERDSADFKVDPLIETGSADDKDYYKSGYDRGHLCPANDNTWSAQAMSDCFYYSNMSPQNHSFNAGIWKKLEMDIHKMALQYDTLYIVTGPVLQVKYKYTTIGPNEVSIPKYFFKVIMAYGTEPKAIGYLIPQTGFNPNYREYACTVDLIERVTGLDFYWGLKDSIEKKIEKTYPSQMP